MFSRFHLWLPECEHVRLLLPPEQDPARAENRKHCTVEEEEDEENKKTKEPNNQQNLNMMIGQGYSATRRPCWRKPLAMDPNTCITVHNIWWYRSQYWSGASAEQLKYKDPLIMFTLTDSYICVWQWKAPCLDKCKLHCSEALVWQIVSLVNVNIASPHNDPKTWQVSR